MNLSLTRSSDCMNPFYSLLNSVKNTRIPNHIVNVLANVISNINSIDNMCTRKLSTAMSCDQRFAEKRPINMEPCIQPSATAHIPCSRQPRTKTTTINIQRYLHNDNLGLLGLTVCYAGILSILPKALGAK